MCGGSQHTPALQSLTACQVVQKRDQSHGGGRVLPAKKAKEVCVTTRACACACGVNAQHMPVTAPLLPIHGVEQGHQERWTDLIPSAAWPRQGGIATRTFATSQTVRLISCACDCVVGFVPSHDQRQHPLRVCRYVSVVETSHRTQSWECLPLTHAGALTLHSRSDVKACVHGMSQVGRVLWSNTRVLMCHRHIKLETLHRPCTLIPRCFPGRTELNARGPILLEHTSTDVSRQLWSL